jgi:putative transposase
LLRENARRAEVRILAYCLMRNHIHLIAIPGTEEGLAVCIRGVHGRYAQYLNARRGRSGHLWQNRFYSCALEHNHLVNALRYVERNPVRAGLAVRPEEYAWSSAAAHMHGLDRSNLVDMTVFRDMGGVEFWRQMLYVEDYADDIRQLRTATYAGRPLGSADFVARIKGDAKWRMAGSNQ